MIYEFRTYDLKPGSVQEVIKRFGDAYEHRQKLSKLTAFWYTKIGPLNQIIHVWPYEDAAERSRIRQEAGTKDYWPPKIAEFIVHQVSEVMVPWSFSPALMAGDHGPYYELRSYELVPGMLKKMQERWQSNLEKRVELSPLGAVMSVDLGTVNKIVHVWPYKSLDQRALIRKEAAEKGIWPPKGGGKDFFKQENKILLPAPFSPMQ